jgi:hypothetical protein
MSMIYVMQQASDATIRALLETPSLIYSFIGREQPTAAKTVGLLARLFGARRQSPVITSTNTMEFETGPNVGDLDKAWHGLHYLLTETDWEGEPPESFLLDWGTEIGTVDLGYGPARAFTAQQTNDIGRCLNQLEPQTLRARFNPARMMELEIYPMIWDRDPAKDDTLLYLMQAFDHLKDFVSNTNRQNFGIVAHLG